MEKYPKINGIFKRHVTGPNKGQFIMGDYAQTEFEYLAGNEWEFVEKVDGCVSPTTNVRMADGSRKRIKDINVGDYVLGYTEAGIVTSRVRAVKMQPKAGEWVKVKATRNGLGSGNSFGQVVCTHDHKIWTPQNGWVEAFLLKPGDKVLASRTDLSLTPIQEQVLIGKMLGDGSLTYHDNSRTASVCFGHVSEALVDWTLRGLGQLAGNKGNRKSGYGSDIITGRSKQMVGVYETFREWVGESKQVPKTITLTPISMAFWYMDDGSLSHNSNQEDRLRLATNGFNDESCTNLLRALKTFGIGGKVKDYKGNTVVLDSENAERFFLLVAPYIPADMQYKLPERYRGHNGWLPPVQANGYKSIAVEQTVVSVDRAPGCERWDIETDTGNFFTVGMLVHNTNIRIGFHNNGLVFGGRSDNAIIPEPLLAHLGSTFILDDLLEHFDIGNSTEVVLFGEGYGPKIQAGGGNYRKDQSFVLFDVRIGSWWLNREDVNDIANKLGIDSVPVIGYGTLKEAIDLVSDGLTSRWGDFEAEGIVARPLVQLFDRKGDRITTKIKGVDFR